MTKQAAPWAPGQDDMLEMLNFLSRSAALCMIGPAFAATATVSAMAGYICVSAPDLGVLIATRKGSKSFADSDQPGARISGSSVQETQQTKCSAQAPLSVLLRNVIRGLGS